MIEFEDLGKRDLDKFPDVTPQITRSEQISFSISQQGDEIFSLGPNTKVIVDTFFGWNEKKEFEKTRPASMEDDDGCDEWDDDWDLEHDIEELNDNPDYQFLTPVPPDEWVEKLGETPYWEDFNATENS
jgi:hypothetical protein